MQMRPLSLLQQEKTHIGKNVDEVESELYHL